MNQNQNLSEIEPISDYHRVIRGEKIVAGGECLGHFNGKPVFCWNLLPGELAQVRIIKKRKGCLYGIAEEIIEPSQERIKPEEPDHYLSCSPWQIVKWESELKWKREEANGHFHKLDLSALDGDIEIFSPDQNQYHYRNKMEFGFTRSVYKDDNSPIKLSLNKRGSYSWKLPLDCCCLAESEINESAQAVCDWLNLHKIDVAHVKTVIARSNGQGESCVALFATEEEVFNELISKKSKPNLPSHCQGFRIYLSPANSPASIVSKTLFGEGNDFLTTELNGTKLRFGLLSFFQVNIPLFTKTLDLIATYLDKEKAALDFYSGVGAISLPLHNLAKSWNLVDSNAEAIELAQKNIDNNGITNAKAECCPAEQVVELINSDQIVIVDPPRAGLHAKVVQRLLEVKPARIIYLACNLSTQARDLELLQENYKIIDLKLFNYFPRTPHLESLCVLDLKK